MSGHGTPEASNLLPKAATTAAFAAALLAFGTTPVFAQESDEKQDDAYIAGLKACQSISEAAERLACYDAAVGKVVEASDEGEVQIVDREQAKKTRRSLFGFSLPDLGIFGGDDDDELFESTITSVAISGRNTVLITIEDGDAVWRIPGAKQRTMNAKPGDKVVFKEASLGSYFIRINGQIGVKGRRIR
ncbi:hypothetical protein [Pontixanthobacter aquaemixtae]|uniref:Uncharacterized protein n=1 Tax=Pontixanthobacter aquaemixtae TaxID=1958940 RepID=A0A844ZVB6_9SPHN|nr:hypothetical protein [Pontixanthobacter aquaemixtae]MXO89479.1 hypothetical protein [Pontixanthobacter aquaemixtae]